MIFHISEDMCTLLNLKKDLFHCACLYMLNNVLLEGHWNTSVLFLSLLPWARCCARYWGHRGKLSRHGIYPWVTYCLLEEKKH